MRSIAIIAAAVMLTCLGIMAHLYLNSPSVSPTTDVPSPVVDARLALPRPDAFAKLNEEASRL
jgi:hypothetical protein